MPKTKGVHHRGTYHVESARVRAAAYANPSTRCWVCGKTLGEIRTVGRWPGDNPHPRAKWTAGHVNDGEPGGMLLPECSPDNYGRGAAAGNRMRGRTKRPIRTLNTSRAW